MASDQRVKPELANVKACVFDTFGTVLDWPSAVIAERALDARLDLRFSFPAKCTVPELRPFRALIPRRNSVV
jgi:hypothetical protein